MYSLPFALPLASAIRRFGVPHLAASSHDLQTTPCLPREANR